MLGIHKTGWIEVGVKAYKMCGVVHCVSSCQFGVEVRDVSEVGGEVGEGNWCVVGGGRLGRGEGVEVGVGGVE